MANQQVGMMAPNGMVAMVPAMGMATGMPGQVRLSILCSFCVRVLCCAISFANHKLNVDLWIFAETLSRLPS